MNSLRARLILGVSIVALVPLALALLLLTDRVERAVESQAAERLGATLGGIRARVAEDGRETAARMQILARDPTLKRLYLVRPVDRRALDDYLAERRFLLGLDFLEILDSTRAVEGFAIEPRSDTTGLALTAFAAIRYQGDPVGSLRGGTFLDTSFLKRIGQPAGVELALRDDAGHEIASTAPDLAGSIRRAGDARAEIAGRSYSTRAASLPIGTPPYPSITAFASTEAADETIRAMRVASALLGALGLGLALLLGALWSSQISRPVERLAAFSDRVARGEWDKPLVLRSVRELETLVAALDRMRRDLSGYRDRLVVSERQAAWGQMARKVAHEIKNPLTPIAISVADLKRSYDSKRPDFPEILDQAARTVSEEVATLRALLQEFSEFGRFPAPRPAPVAVADLFADLRALYAGPARSGSLRFDTPADRVIVDADPGQLRQALINLIKNGLEAIGAADATGGPEGTGDVPPGGRVLVSARGDADALEIDVADSGPGLSPEQRASLFVPGFTTKPHGSGLGLTIVERIVSEHGGTIAVDATPGGGTTFRIRVPRVSPLVRASSAGGT